VKSRAARLKQGASIVNDISGATFDPLMLETVSSTNAGIVLMHLRGTPQAMRASESFGAVQNVVDEVLGFWRERLQAARALGIEDERICFDAGFGFGKSLDENLELIRRGRELRDFGFPILSGTSRKSTIGRVLGDLPVDERLFGTAATVALSIAYGADVVRVHDVKEMAQVARMSDAIMRT
jgi:dihydropteroate synthase